MLPQDKGLRAGCARARRSRRMTSRSAAVAPPAPHAEVRADVLCDPGRTEAELVAAARGELACALGSAPRAALEEQQWKPALQPFDVRKGAFYCRPDHVPAHIIAVAQAARRAA